jgi:hypothetical protein
VVEPMAAFLREVVTRFEQHAAFEARRQPLRRIWTALRSLLGPDKALDPAACGVRGRRLQDTVQTVDRWAARTAYCRLYLADAICSGGLLVAKLRAGGNTHAGPWSTILVSRLFATPRAANLLPLYVPLFQATAVSTTTRDRAACTSGHRLLQPWSDVAALQEADEGLRTAAAAEQVALTATRQSPPGERALFTAVSHHCHNLLLADSQARAIDDEVY